MFSARTVVEEWVQKVPPYYSPAIVDCSGLAVDYGDVIGRPAREMSKSRYANTRTLSWRTLSP